MRWDELIEMWMHIFLHPQSDVLKQKFSYQVTTNPFWKTCGGKMSVYGMIGGSVFTPCCISSEKHLCSFLCQQWDDISQLCSHSHLNNLLYYILVRPWPSQAKVLPSLLIAGYISEVHVTAESAERKRIWGDVTWPERRLMRVHWSVEAVVGCK